MPDQQVLWTALPRSAGEAELELDVFVSPRLGIDVALPSYTLSDFPEFEHWTKTLETRLSFSVEFADGSVEPAQVVPAELDHVAWDHIFRPATFVRPWSFRDLSERPIYSFPTRFVTAYLRDLYRDVGRTHLGAPPTGPDLDGLRKDLGGLTDVRVHDERKPPRPEPRELPTPRADPRPDPPREPEGCLTWLCRWLRPLGPLLRRIRIRLGLPPLCPPAVTAEPADPTKPKTAVPRTVHPSPYVAREPIPPAHLPALDALEQRMAADKVVRPGAKLGDMGAALAGRDVSLDFAQVKRFYERPEAEPPPGGWPPPKLPELDFHQALGALGDYPAMLRALGLLVRLRVPRPASAPGSVRVIAAWDSAARTSDVSPRTHCAIDGERLVAERGAGSDLDGGMLDLRGASDRLATDAPDFDVIQVDSDGAAIKALLHAASLERAWQLAVEKILGVDLFPEEPTPALRSGGLAIVRAGRAARLHDRLVAAKALSVVQPAPAPDTPASLPSELFADDLVRGYRIEVSDDGGATWLSLCWRVGRYRLVDDAGNEVPHELPEVVDEGYVKGTSAASGGGPADPLYVHEALARWTGWSLTVPRPGRTLEPGTAAEPRAPGERYEKPELPKSDASRTEFRFSASFTPKPGTLPRLRFGQAYRLRAVCVDLAGEPIAPPQAGAASTEDVTYRRFEPAAPPALLPLRRYAPGESLERLVVVSDFDRDNPTWEAEETSLTPAQSSAHRTRHVFPPKTSQQMVELHGKLDEPPFQAFGPGAAPDAAYRVALREAGTFRDEKLIDIHTVDVDNPVPTIPFGKPQEVHAGSTGAYVVNRHDATLPIPYLPDPAVGGVALRGVPGLVDHVDGDPLTVLEVLSHDDPTATEPLLQIPYDGTWPDVQPLRLRVAERTSGHTRPHWDAAARVLTVFLRKAAQREIRYGSYLRGGELDRHGVWDWVDDGDAGGKLRLQAEAGGHWMISPARTLALVHAVQRPLQPASFPALTASRKLGETSAALTGKLSMHSASTGRIDVIGAWKEWRDPVDGNDFDEREGVAGDFKIEADWGASPPFPLPSAKPGEQVRHEFGDTKHRWVDYRVRATTRFREYLDPATPVTSLTRETDPSDVLAVNVPSSARPDAPRVLYAVPTFAWQGGEPAAGWQAHASERRGGGLRVFLEPPWYSSGEGELLAVVLQANEPQKLPESLRSRYGADATWRGAVDHATVGLQPEHFPNRVDAAKGLSIADNPGLTGTAVAFKPEWNATRGLWFCDVDMDVGALPWNYWPFVRLAFARYQPDSVKDAELSPLALGEFGQVAPDRSLSLAWDGDQAVDVTLAGRAPQKPFPPRVALRVQEAAAGSGADPDELDWKYVAGHPEAVDWPGFMALVEPTDPDADGTVTWTSKVQLPAPRGSGARVRLEIAEYELIRADSELGRGIARITYAAHVPLD